MICWSRIAELHDEIGDDAFGEVVILFLEEVDDTTASLPGATDLGAALHCLKGSALNLGFQAVAALCQQGETLCRAGRADQIDVSAIIHCYAESKTAFLANMTMRKSA
ncbi:MAG: Hpt domain-containing protein [Rhodobacteraceae bacterium]|nr:Hpt domain-containing protein [Paracoccaceae bacterium]